eukprot:5137670-Amphidinium_carterae.1
MEVEAELQARQQELYVVATQKGPVRAVYGETTMKGEPLEALSKIYETIAQGNEACQVIIV